MLRNHQRHPFSRTAEGIVLGLCLLAAGCTLASDAAGVGRFEQEKQESLRRISQLNPRFVNPAVLKKNMSVQEVRMVLGDEVVVGYESDPNDPSVRRPLRLSQPHRAFEVTKDGRRYRIEAYRAGVAVADGLSQEEEWLFLIYHDDRLIAMGKEAVARLAPQVLNRL